MRRVSRGFIWCCLSVFLVSVHAANDHRTDDSVETPSVSDANDPAGVSMRVNTPVVRPLDPAQKSKLLQLRPRPGDDLTWPVPAERKPQ
jgi:hypothetical protein